MVTSLSSQSCSIGFDTGDGVGAPLDGCHGDHLGRVLGAAAGGGNPYGPLSCGDQLLLLRFQIKFWSRVQLADICQVVDPQVSGNVLLSVPTHVVCIPSSLLVSSPQYLP